ncbi:hypothetical protein VZT92_002147 [Zoarces viviparus]|uniref:Secreted protein n=1 Tax=Zoarces viviparus TaxID=48416 RepID=A0AAW1FXN3_ZOAVI
MSPGRAAGQERLFKRLLFSTLSHYQSQAMAPLACVPAASLVCWHVHSGGCEPGSVYLPPCGAHCRWHRTPTGMSALPSRSCHLGSTAAKAPSTLPFSGCG